MLPRFPLRKELYPVRITRRVDDRVTFEHPVWRVDVAPDVAGRSVAVVDEMADTGETLSLVAARVREYGAARVVTAALASHSWAEPKPDVTGFVTDALVVFPWTGACWWRDAGSCTPSWRRFSARRSRRRDASG